MPVVDFISCVFVQFGYCHHSCHAVIVCHHSHHHHHRVGIYHFLSHNSYFVLYDDENFLLDWRRRKFIFDWKKRKCFKFSKSFIIWWWWLCKHKINKQFFLGFLDSDSLDDNLIIIDFHIFFFFFLSSSSLMWLCGHGTFDFDFIFAYLLSLSLYLISYTGYFWITFFCWKVVNSMLTMMMMVIVVWHL